MLRTSAQFTGSKVRHGTESGYSLHRRRGEPACTACLDAHADYHRDYQARTGWMRSRRRAWVRLAAMYPNVYRRLLDEELGREQEVA